MYDTPALELKSFDTLTAVEQSDLILRVENSENGRIAHIDSFHQNYDVFDTLSISSLRKYLFSICNKSTSQDIIMPSQSPLSILSSVIRETFLRHFDGIEPSFQHTVSWKTTILGDIHIIHILFFNSHDKWVRSSLIMRNLWLTSRKKTSSSSKV